MPLSWCISHPSRLVIAVGKGELDPQDMIEFMQRIDAASARPYAKMIDVTGLTAKFTGDKIRAFALAIRRREAESEVGPIAVVAGSPDTHRQAILFAKEAQGLRPIKVFREQHDARRWLNAFCRPERLRPLGVPGAAGRVEASAPLTR